MIVCQTNFVPDFRSCIIRGEHEATCDGHEHRGHPTPVTSSQPKKTAAAATLAAPRSASSAAPATI